jgi:hypothetical protein
MKKVLRKAGLFLAIQFTTVAGMLAQTAPVEEKHAVCGTINPSEKREEGFQQQLRAFKSSAINRTNTVITIPVIVHILYKTGQAVGKTPIATTRKLVLSR